MKQLNEFDDLLDLQTVDLAIDHLLGERSSLPALDQYKEAHEAAAAASAELEVLEEEAKRIRLALDKSDGELTIGEGKRDAEERRLYAGGLNARETGALMAEVEMLKRQTAEMEVQTLDLMEQRDNHQVVVDAKAAVLDEVKASEERLKGVIETAWAEIDAEIARQEDEGSAALGETTFLVAPRAGVLTVLDKVEGTGFLRAAPRVGEKVPVHATAVGKLFLAAGAVALPAGASLPRFTEQTPRSRKALERQVRQVAEQGWAHSRDQWIEGLSVVAAPISSRGNPVAAIAVATSTPRMDALGAPEVARRSVEAAARIGLRLEGRGE